MLILEPRTSDDDTPESEASIGTADSSENITLQGATSDLSGECFCCVLCLCVCAYSMIKCVNVCRSIILNKLCAFMKSKRVIFRSPFPAIQSLALISPGSRRQSADELCAASPTPRTLQTPTPLLPTTPHPPSPPTPQVLPPLTTGSAPPPQGPCSPPMVWGRLWQRQRGPKMLAKPATGSG